MLVADSCLCGISVLQYVNNSDGSIFYLADYEKNPFGLKTKNEVIGIVKNRLSYANEHGIKKLVIPCNTASLAISEIKYSLEISYNILIRTTIEAFEDMLQDITLTKNVLLIATKGTITSGVYQKYLTSLDGVILDTLIGTHLESCIAKGMIDQGQMELALDRDIAAAGLPKQQYASIICGCSCFVYAREMFADYFSLGIGSIYDPIKWIVLGKKNKKNSLQNTQIYYTKPVSDLDIPMLSGSFLRLLEMSGNIQCSLIKIR